MFALALTIKIICSGISKSCQQMEIWFNWAIIKMCKPNWNIQWPPKDDTKSFFFFFLFSLVVIAFPHYNAFCQLQRILFSNCSFTSWQMFTQGIFSFLIISVQKDRTIISHPILLWVWSNIHSSLRLLPHLLLMITVIW